MTSPIVSLSLPGLHQSLPRLSRDPCSNPGDKAGLDLQIRVCSGSSPTSASLLIQLVAATEEGLKVRGHLSGALRA